MQLNKKKIIFVSRSFPWSVYANSGCTEVMCKNLQGRGLLVGALSEKCRTLRHLKKKALLAGLEKNLTRCLVKRKIIRPASPLSEKRGLLRVAIDQCDAAPVMIYFYAQPEIDPSLSIERVALWGISHTDAVKYRAYGYDNLTAEEMQERRNNNSRFLNSMTRMLTHSNYIADSISKDYCYPRTNISAIGTTTSLASSIAKRPLLTQQREGNKILFIGRDFDRKNGPLVVEACRLARKKVTNLKLTIVGPDKSPFREDWIDFLGLIDKNKNTGHEHLIRIYQTHSLFCMPSKYETWGLVYIEAMASGLPIVGFDTWAMPDIVTEDCGRLTPNHTAEGLADCFCELLENRHKLSLMRSAARSRYNNVFRINHVVDRLLFAIDPAFLGTRKPVLMQEV